jgi:hypothetical protein
MMWSDTALRIAMRPQDQDCQVELEKLFAELGEAYARAREGVTAPATTQVSLHVREEAAKASDIIRRIRQLQGL